MARRKVLSICLGLFALAVWDFWPSVGNGFVNLDDPLYVCENVHVLGGLTWHGVGWAFTSFDGGFWHPLTWLSLMADCQLFGLRAGYHHLISLLFHASSTVLLFVALRRITGATWRSTAVAGLFAIHPLHVESVAWVSDRKDVLSALFCTLALLTYARYVERFRASATKTGSSLPGDLLFFGRPISRWYLLCLLFFVCGLMSKATVLTLPFVFLLLDWWPLRRFNHSTARQLFLEKVPFLAVAVPAALISIYGQQHLGALPDTVQYPVSDRISNAALSFVQYLFQTLWPAGLAAYYPYPAAFPIRQVVAAALLSLTLTVLLLWVARRRPYLAVGWLWWVITLLPVIGLMQTGGQSRADRYTYIPLIGLFLLIVWATHDFTRRWRYQAVGLSSIAVIVGAVCLLLSQRQIGYWQDSEALLRHAVAVTPDNSMAYNNLGVALSKQKQLDEAVKNLLEAIRIAPTYAEAYNNLGTALALQGRLDEAIARFQQSLSLKPRYAQAHNDLGAALGRLGRLDDAIAHLEEAIALAPSLADARCNLGDALAAKGRMDEAISQYEQAIRLNPNYPDTLSHLGIALASKGHLDDAINQFQQALKLSPDYPQAHTYLGIVLSRKGRLEDAVIHLQEAVRLSPNSAVAQNALRAVLAARAGLPSQPHPPPPP